MLYMVLNTMILPVWIPMSGLLWWYRFYKNMLEDSDGRSLLEIFSNPNVITLIHPVDRMYKCGGLITITIRRIAMKMNMDNPLISLQQPNFSWRPSLPTH